MCLMAVDKVTASRLDGSVILARNRYHCPQLAQHKGAKVVLRFDPAALHESVHVYSLTGLYIGQAECIQQTGFADMDTAKEHNRQRSRYKKAVKAQHEAEKRISDLELQSKLPVPDDPERIPIKMVRPMFKRPKVVISAEEREKLFVKGVKKQRAMGAP